MWICKQSGMFLHFLLFHTHLPDPPSSLLSFLPRWSPHWGGGNPGAGHREPHHLRRDRPALGYLRLCSQQAWHPGEKNSTGPAGGARCVSPHLLPCSLPHRHPWPKSRTLDLPSYLSLPSPSTQARPRGQLPALPQVARPGKGRSFLVMGPCVPLQWASTHPQSFHCIFSASFPPCVAHMCPLRHVPFPNMWHLHAHTCQCALSVSLIFTPTLRLPPHTQSWPLHPQCVGPLTVSFCPSSCPGTQLSPGNGLGIPFSGVVCGCGLPEI